MFTRLETPHRIGLEISKSGAWNNAGSSWQKASSSITLWEKKKTEIPVEKLIWSKIMPKFK
jgi:hypothetical protein